MKTTKHTVSSEWLYYGMFMYKYGEKISFLFQRVGTIFTHRAWNYNPDK